MFSYQRRPRARLGSDGLKEQSYSYLDVKKVGHRRMGMFLDEEESHWGLVGQELDHLVHPFLHFIAQQEKKKAKSIRWKRDKKKKVRGGGGLPFMKKPSSPWCILLPLPPTPSPPGWNRRSSRGSKAEIGVKRDNYLPNPRNKSKWFYFLLLLLLLLLLQLLFWKITIIIIIYYYYLS